VWNFIQLCVGRQDFTSTLLCVAIQVCSFMFFFVGDMCVVVYYSVWEDIC